ncbi:MAG: hypothetical protein Q4D51_04665 [Eubacteriales bacterium]|nr:hypothetical protein [Eubacteriales bacterium]
MYECPNCSGNLVFDIVSQRIKCPNCDSKFDPYEVTNQKELEHQDSMDMNVFMCTQCSGVIYSTDDAATAFCSYCGATSVLTSRLVQKKRPRYIIPFKKTKKDCKDAYISLMKKAWYAPRELRNPKYIKEFRGIYMPYWIYDVTQKGYVQIEGKTVRYKGDYKYTDHYQLGFDLDNEYDGIAYDASPSFADSISEKVAPFEMRWLKEFTPSFLSGFYADMADVDEDVYGQDAKIIAAQGTKRQLQHYKEIQKYDTKITIPMVINKCHTNLEKIDSAMLPVWFMSYRNHDRIAYAIVNGQTGKVVADIPVDLKRYYMGSAFLAVPIFIILNLFLTLTPKTLLLVICFISLFAIMLHDNEMKQISIRESNSDDKGLLAYKDKKRREKRRKQEEALRLAEERIRQAEEMERAERERKEETAVTQERVTYKSSLKLADTPETEEVLRFVENEDTPFSNPDFVAKERNIKPDLITIDDVNEDDEAQYEPIEKNVAKTSFVLQSVVLVVLMAAAVAIHIFAPEIGVSGYFFSIPIVTFVAILYGCFSMKHGSEVAAKKGKGAIGAILSCVLASGICIWNPVQDIFYYGAVVVAVVMMIITLADLIASYNLLAMRKLPQFERTGGDDRADI